MHGGVLPCHITKLKVLKLENWLAFHVAEVVVKMKVLLLNFDSVDIGKKTLKFLHPYIL